MLIDGFNNFIKNLIMKVFKIITAKFVSLIAIVFVMTACKGSRQRQIIDAYGKAYEEYEKTGDPTFLIVMIIAGIVVIGLFIWKQFKD